MTYEESEALSGLLDLWAGRPVRLTCAQDVFGEMQEFPLAEGTEIRVIPHYQPGQWKLTLHNACDVIGGEKIDYAVIVSHDHCTVIAENGT